VARLKEGSRVMRSDVGPDSIPSYRALRGTVTGFDWAIVWVQWDVDRPPCAPPCRDPRAHCGPTRHDPEDLAPVCPNCSEPAAGCACCAGCRSPACASCSALRDDGPTTEAEARELAKYPNG
jgi:hypothetical protein